MSYKSELRNGMRIDWDVPITMDDGLVLRADIYRPPQEGKYPVILSYGPYAKGLSFQEGFYGCNGEPALLGLEMHGDEDFWPDLLSHTGGFFGVDGVVSTHRDKENVH